MSKTDKFIIIFVLAILFAASVIIVLKLDRGYYTYKGLYGDFIIDKFEVGNVTLYNVHTVSEGKRYVLPLRNRPEDVEDIYLENNILKKLNRPEGIGLLYITKDPEINKKTENKATLSVIEFGRILGTNEYGIYKINSRSAVTEPINDSSVPVITCSNTTLNISVIHVKLGDDNRIYSEGNCVIIEGEDGDGLLKSSSKFAYHLMGIM